MLKNTIVTGATGFIGSWLVDELLENNINVTIICRNINNVAENHKCNDRCHIIEKDLNSINSSDFKKGEYDAFFHLGWGGVEPKEKNNIDIQIENIRNSIRAMNVCNELKCKKFVAAGTVAEYVFCESVMDYSAKQTPNDMYGAAKVSTHYFLDVYSRQICQPFIWMILPSTYGEGRKDDNIITYSIKTLLKGEKPSYGSLNQMWDFLYVKDVVRGIRLIGEKGIPNKIYGIGSGIYKPLKDYVTIIRDIINPNLKLGIGERKDSNNTLSSCVNIDEICKDTGFEPITKFEEGIQKTINWIEKNL